MALLFNPATYNPSSFDEATRSHLLALVDFFETKGLATEQGGVLPGEWYTDFLDLIARDKIFATFATPAEVGAQTRHTRCALGPGAYQRTQRGARLLLCWRTGTPGGCPCSAWARCG